MKKFAFLMAFLAGLAFAVQTWAAGSPDDDSHSGGNDVTTPVAEGSGSGTTKSGPFTPAEAATATEDDGKNSVTINF